MEKLITVKDVCERYSCTLPTARKYMRQMFHYEHPLTVPKWSLDAWEQSRECAPSGKIRTINHRKTDRVIIPRHR